MLHPCNIKPSSQNFYEFFYCKINFHKIKKAVRAVGKKLLVADNIPPEQMPAFYNKVEMLVSIPPKYTGFGLAWLEAMACGVPCILPAWSAFGDWAKPAAHLVPCTSTALTAPMNGACHTIGGVMDEDEAVESLNLLYNDRETYARHQANGLELARSLTWSRTGEKFDAVLRKVLSSNGDQVQRG